MFILFVFVSFTILVDSPAYAQDKSSWVSRSFRPAVADIAADQDIFQSDVDLNGREFRVGLIVRGGHLVVTGVFPSLVTQLTLSPLSGRGDDVCGGYPDSEIPMLPDRHNISIEHVFFDGLEVHK